MQGNQHHLHWVRENILLYLSQADQVLCTIVPASLGEPGARTDEPWIDTLFERRRGLQSTLAEVEQQIGENRM
jgi:hypothetical protein